MIPITPLHYVVLSAVLFVIGIIVVMFRRNIIVTGAVKVLLLS